MNIPMLPWLTCLMGLFLLQPVTASQARDESVRVEVVNSANHRAITGARVFVLSTEGKELASATTDNLGFASLPVLDESRHPKYVIVDHPAFFVSGVRWQVGLEDYYILMTILVVK